MSLSNEPTGCRWQKCGFIRHHCRLGRESHLYRTWNRTEILHPRRPKVRSLGPTYRFSAFPKPANQNSMSQVTITLKNQGDEAYKPKEFGKSIVITRQFNVNGGSSWKIKSRDGKLISTKKDELAAICDHMNIQVDNPMNVLTQGVWLFFPFCCIFTLPDLTWIGYWLTSFFL